MLNFAYVGIGGFLGAIARFGVAQIISSSGSTSFPFSTLLVNVSGCLAIGTLSAFLKDHPTFDQLWLFLVVGVLGAFTTFSAFSFETIQLFKKGPAYLALLNMGGSLALCLLATVLGIGLGGFLKS